MKKDSRRSQRVADLVRAELALLVLTEAHDPELRKRHDHRRRDAAGPEVGARLLLLSRRRRGAGEGRGGSPAGVGLPAPRGRPALPAALRAGALLPLRPLARARRPDRGAPAAGPSAAGGRRTSRERARHPAEGFSLPHRQARRPDLPRRRRARARGDRGRAHRPQRHARSHGDRAAPALRRRRRAPAELLHAHGQVLRGHDPSRPRDHDLRPRGRSRRARPRRVRRDARGGRGRGRRLSAASFSRRLRPTPPRRSAGGSSTRWRARARACRRLPKKVRVSELAFGPLEDGRLAFSIACTSGTYIRSIASELGEKLGCGAHLESLRRTRIGVFSASDAVALEQLRGPAAGGAPCRRPTPSLSRGFPFPFPRVQLASLEAWKIRRGQAVPARGVAAGRATGSRSSDPPTTCWPWAR